MSEQVRITPRFNWHWVGPTYPMPVSAVIVACALESTIPDRYVCVWALLDPQLPVEYVFQRDEP
jgi:hypothetical protein